MPQWQGTETGKEADAEGKVTNCGDVLLTASLLTARTILSRFFKLDAIVDESPVIPRPVPRWTITSSVA